MLSNVQIWYILISFTVLAFIAIIAFSSAISEVAHAESKDKALAADSDPFNYPGGPGV